MVCVKSHLTVSQNSLACQYINYLSIFGIEYGIMTNGSLNSEFSTTLSLSSRIITASLLQDSWKNFILPIEFYYVFAGTVSLT